MTWKRNQRSELNQGPRGKSTTRKETSVGHRENQQYWWKIWMKRKKSTRKLRILEKERERRERNILVMWPLVGCSHYSDGPTPKHTQKSLIGHNGSKNLMNIVWEKLQEGLGGGREEGLGGFDQTHCVLTWSSHAINKSMLLNFWKGKVNESNLKAQCKAWPIGFHQAGKKEHKGQGWQNATFKHQWGNKRKWALPEEYPKSRGYDWESKPKNPLYRKRNWDKHLKEEVY